ncbi:MAG: hypothetical protein PHC83_06410, partial [Bacteroidales bacterium]|nr:hypothetical protein [Bacteroidales bacterium]
IKKSAPILEDEGNYPRAIIKKKQYQLDNFTDAMILNQIYSIDNERPFYSFLWAKHQIKGGLKKVEDLALRVNEPKEPNAIYPRYWHGNTFLARPLFLIGDFSQIRWLIYCFTSLMFILFCCVIYHKTNLIYALAMASGLLFVNFFVTQFSIQLSPVIVLALLSSILICYNNQHVKRIPMIFFIFGSLTAYMDLLTTPILTLGIPLMVYFLIKKDNIENGNFIKNIQTLILFALLWALGYGFTWISKWLIATVFTDMNVFKDAWDATMYRMQSNADQIQLFSRLDAVLVNINMLPWGYINSLLCVLLILVVSFFNKKGIKKAFLFLIIACIPYIWYFVLANHSFLHWWFTYRAQAITVSCLFIVFIQLISKEKILIFLERIKILHKKNVIRKTVIFFFFIIVFLGCTPHKTIDNTSNFVYPSSKVWAHKANDTADAQRKKELFAGLEVDLYYSEYQKTIYVGHDAYDTINEVSFEKWLNALSSPEKTYYWLDIKNLTIHNANEIAKQLVTLAKKHTITSNLMVEHTDCDALQIVKNSGLAVILWVDNLYWWDKKDTMQWYNITKEKINALQPHAISCEYRMYPLLTKSFPTQNVHFWNTPIEDSLSNRALTREMCLDTSVKVVLVDYESVNF